MSPHRQNFEVLLVEDSPTDQKLFCLAVREDPLPLHCVTNGEEALAWLHSHRGSLPHLIVLDLNIPIKDGFEVLEEVKAHPEYKTIPIVVFSTSSSEKDIQRCYRLGANSFISKPLDLDKYLEAVKKTTSYWKSICAHSHTVTN